MALYGWALFIHNYVPIPDDDKNVYNIFTGVIYNALKTLDLSEGTRDYLERAEFAFGPDPMLISATRLIRNSVYGPTGRILFNAIFSPQETADEFRSFTIKEHVDRALSDSFLR